MGMHQSLVKFFMDKAPSASAPSTNGSGRYPGTPQKRAPEGEVIKRAGANKGIFGDRSALNRRRLKDGLRRDKGTVPGMGGVAYTKKERLTFEQEDLSKEKYGTHLTRHEIGKEIKDIDKKIKYSRELKDKEGARRKKKYFEYLKGNKDGR